MTKPPAFQFYAQDFMTGTLTMTLTERGAYITLLCHQWDKGGVEGDNLVELSKILGCTPVTARQVWTRIAHKFFRDAKGIFRNRRLEKERAKQRRFRKSQSNKGKLSAQRRNRGSTGVQPMAVASRFNPSSSSSSSDQVHPQPPRAEGARITREERRQAESAIDQAFLRRQREGFQGRPIACPHDPPHCPTRASCVEREARAARARKAS